MDIRLLFRFAAATALSLLMSHASALNCRYESGDRSYVPATLRGFITMESAAATGKLLFVSPVLNTQISCRNDRGVLQDNLVLLLNPDARAASLQGIEIGVQPYGGVNSVDGVVWGNTAWDTGIVARFASTATTERIPLTLQYRIFARAVALRGTQSTQNDIPAYQLLHFQSGQSLLTMQVRTAEPSCTFAHEISPSTVEFGQLAKGDLATGKTVDFSLILRSSCNLDGSSSTTSLRPYGYFSTPGRVHQMGAEEGLQMNDLQGNDAGLIVVMSIDGHRIGWTRSMKQLELTPRPLQQNVPLAIPMAAHLKVRDAALVKPGPFRGMAMITVIYR